MENPNPKNWVIVIHVQEYKFVCDGTVTEAEKDKLIQNLEEKGVKTSSYQIK